MNLIFAWSTIATAAILMAYMQISWGKELGTSTSFYSLGQERFIRHNENKNGV
jgi:hypothetical protein